MRMGPQVKRTSTADGHPSRENQNCVEMLDHRSTSTEETDDADPEELNFHLRRSKEHRPGRGFLSRVASAAEPETPLPKAHFRLVVMGAARVGKTAIIQRFLNGQFPERYSATVEELHRGDFEVGGSALTLDILDTSGSYEFPAMRHLAINTGDAFLLVYSVVDAESFEEVRRLRQLTTELRPAGVPTVVVGNKDDLSEVRVVQRELAEGMACLDWEHGYAECSAKNGSNVVEVFKILLLQSNLQRVLTPAIRTRRRSLPVIPGLPGPSGPRVNMRKRNSCAVS